MKSRFFSYVKAISAVSINVGLFKTAIHQQQLSDKSFGQLSEKEQFELKVRDFALKDNPYYLSEVPYLRAMAIANYSNNPHAKLLAKHQYLAHESANEQQRRKLSR